MKASPFFSKKKDGSLFCTLCAFHCSIQEGKQGICGVRENQNGTLYSLNYRKIVALHADPVEKKPLFHFLPGSKTFSLACSGCNFSCSNCQNWEISQQFDASTPTSPTPLNIVEAAVQQGCRSIAYTYTEPTIYAETALEIAETAKEKDLLNIFVTNGYASNELTDAIAGTIDAANIDLKFFSTKSYKKICGGVSKEIILNNIAEWHKRGIWVEVTTLLIPELNDSNDEIREIARFLASVSPDIPWHISGFYPMYKMTETSPTSIETLARAWNIGKEEGLRYVYMGNRPGYGGEETICPSCGTMLIDRYQFRLKENRLKNGTCPDCSTPIAGVW